MYQQTPQFQQNSNYSQPTDYTPPPARKKNKAWVIALIILLAICGCCVLIILGTGGYFYMFPDAANQLLENAVDSALMPNPEIAQNAMATQTSQADMDLKKGGYAIPFNLIVPEGIKVLEKGAFVAADEEDPGVCHLYVGYVLQSSIPVYKLKVDRKVWTLDSYDGNKEKLSDTTNAANIPLLIPTNQISGYFEGKSNPYASWNKPSKVEINLTIPDDLEDYEQKALNKLQNGDLPNPFFTLGQVEMNVGSKDATGLYRIEAKAKIKSNLPVNGYGIGLFVFYDGDGNVIGMSTASCKDLGDCSSMDSVKLDSNAEDELNMVLPYKVQTPPVKAVIYQIVDSGIGQNLTTIK